ncbi:MAG: autoinducer binding domain-containing protein [Ideonella sp. WA131b]|jgi:DNA-binding CsgD family transcriptional regulator|nr:autoinducer binding domain-containing protein [Ideonella sp. WA131b]
MIPQDFQQLGLSKDRASFEAGLVAIAQSLDFEIASAAVAVDRPGREPIFEMLGNIPLAWSEAARDASDAARDPVMQRMRNSGVPFAYDQQLYVAEGAGDLWESQAPFGYRTGIAIAMHLPGGHHFLLGVDRSRALPAERVAANRLVADICLLAVHAQEAAMRVLLPDTPQPAPAQRLTRREVEVLNWTKEGKSAWAVGQILGMSEATVQSHLRNVRRKMGVSSKHQAILRAIALGLITQ